MHNIGYTLHKWLGLGVVAVEARFFILAVFRICEVCLVLN